MTDIEFTKGFQRCGEITIAMKFTEKIYAYNCLFCGETCFNVEDFTTHIDEKHNDKFFYETIEENSVPYGIDEEELDDVHNEILQMGHHELVKADPLNGVILDELPDNKCVSNVSPDPELHLFKDNCYDKQEDNVDIADIKQEEILISRMNDCVSDTEMKSYKDMTVTEKELEFQNNLEDCDKSVTLALIDNFEKERILWDSADPLVNNRKKREEALLNIASNIRDQLGIEMNTKEINLRLVNMRKQFCSAVENQQRVKKQNDATALWYFDKLSFLGVNFKCKIRRKRGATALESDKTTLPLPNLTHKQTMQLIEIYKSFPCLWDVQHIGFRFKHQRQKTVEEMLQAVKEKMQISINEEELRKMLYRIRYACTQEKHRKLQCEQEQQKYEANSKYYEQFAFLEENVGPFKCDYCDKMFHGADQYKIHKSKHDGSMPFICPICNRGFTKVGNCTVHLRRHTKDYNFECKICGKRFATSTDVTVHMRYHTGDKPYFCEMCGQSFRTWTFFDSHRRRHQKKPSHKCSICSRGFYENNKLTEHMKAHLNIRDKVCNVCGKAFTCTKYLRQHEQIHFEKKKYICKICGKDFAQYAGLSGHMKSHGTTLSSVATKELK